jgi:hypothetical protein
MSPNILHKATDASPVGVCVGTRCAVCQIVGLAVLVYPWCLCNGRVGPFGGMQYIFRISHGFAENVAPCAKLCNDKSDFLEMALEGKCLVDAARRVPWNPRRHRWSETSGWRPKILTLPPQKNQGSQGATPSARSTDAQCSSDTRAHPSDRRPDWKTALFSRASNLMI